jgi:sensor histidine kinase YesM
MTHEELLGWGWQNVLHPDEVSIKLERSAESLRTGQVFEIEYRLRPAGMKRGAAGLGLLSIEERARLLRGAVRIESAKGNGTTVRVVVPQGRFDH